MKKPLAFAAGSCAAMAMALISAGHATSTGPIDVTGETYGQAAAMLKQQGLQAVLGGAVGGDVPQAQCIVESEKLLPGWPTARVALMLNCTKAAQPPPQAPTPGVPGVVPGAPVANPGPPTVGGNGITTVTATPVAPQPIPAPPPPPPAAPPPAPDG